MSAAQGPSKAGPRLAIVATVVVVATLVAAFMQMRSPSAQRDVTLDQRRVQELERIGFAIDAYVTLHDTLPPDLATLAAQPGTALPQRDPVSGEAYVYEPLRADRYRLCATFATDTAETGEALRESPRQSWAHGAGHQCFERVAAPQRAMPSAPAA